MQLCSRCHKRAAVVFITKYENGKSVQEGLCLHCAKELGIAQVDNVLQNMGISEEDIDNMENEMNALIAGGTDEDNSDDDEENNSRTPAIDFAKLFGGSKKKKQSKIVNKKKPMFGGLLEKGKGKSEPVEEEPKATVRASRPSGSGRLHSIRPRRRE